MTDFKSFEKHFPYESMRREQRAALAEVDVGWRNMKKYAVLELPTGVGKSAIAMAIARAVADDGGNAYIITPQKVLQDQYAKEYDDLSVLKGKGTYDCVKFPGKSCANAPCVKDKEIRDDCGDSCLYKQAVEDALAGEIALMNMDNFYYQSKFGRFKGQSRDVLIVDEAHKIEQKFMGFYSLELLHGDRYGQVPEYEHVRDYIPFMQTAVEKLKDKLRIEKIKTDTSEEIEDLEREIYKVESAVRQIKTVEWVMNKVTHFEDGRNVFEGVELKRLFVDDIIPDALFSYGRKVVVLSATIIDHEQFSKNVGIDKNNAVYYSCPSPFNKASRPIYFYNSGPMSMRGWDGSKEKLLHDVKEILAKHKNDRGIIHTYSNKIATFIERNINDPRLIFKNARRNVYDVLSLLDDSDNGVIVGSGMEEGIDLKDDLSRFQIICKIPYPSLGDAQIARRLKLDPAYYQYLTVLTIVQAYGRSVRNEKDYAKTYILDSDFDRLRRGKLPEWFNEAVENEDQQTIPGV